MLDKTNGYAAPGRVLKGLHIDGQCVPVITTSDLQRLFNVTYMTIYNWRRYKALPCITVPCNTVHNVYFHKDAIRKWADDNDKEYLMVVARELGVEPG
jgi:hypothetical protein